MDDVKNPVQAYAESYRTMARTKPANQQMVSLHSVAADIEQNMAPLWGAQRMRADTAEAERDEQKRLRASSEGSNAAWRMTVGLAETMLENPAYELSGVDWDYEHSIHDKIRAKNAQLADAEQRIAELSADNQQLRKLLEQTLAALNPTAKLSKSIRAALNPKPEAGSHEHR